MLQQLVNGLILGSVYALIALGYTMVYGIIKLIKFAHGDLYMMGAFIGYYLINSFQLNFFLALILTMVGVPAEGIGLILGVDRFLDMCRTTLNVVGDLVAATVVSRVSPSTGPRCAMRSVRTPSTNSTTPSNGCG